MNNSSNNNAWASAFFDSITMAEEAAVAVAAVGILPRYTDHTYHDFSTYIEDGGKIEKHKKSESNFPARLYAILCDEQYSHIISWLPHGRAWKVLNKKLLIDDVIPKFFGQSKYASFTRQLSGWGFKRLHQTGPDFGCYYHECFLRGHPRLTILMRRMSSGKGKATPNTLSEPDFYAIAKQYPLRATGKEPIYSLEDDKKKKKEEEDTEEEEAETTKAKESTAPQDVVTSFDTLPVSSHDNLDSFAALAASSRWKNGLVATQDGTVHTMYSAPMFIIGATTGNLYQNVQAQGGQGHSQPPQQTAAAATSICAEDGLCATSGSCHGGSSNNGNQHSLGHQVVQQHPYPHLQNSFQDPSMMFHSSSLGYGRTNLYNQFQPNNGVHQGQARVQGQPTHCHRSCASTAATSRPNSISHNPWTDNRAVTNDSLQQMPMSIPDQGFDFNISSLEESFRNSPVDPPPTTTAFLG